MTHGSCQPIVDPSVIPLPVIVSGVLASRLPKRPLSKEDHPTQAFIFDRPDKSLGMRIQVGGSRWQAYGLDTSFGQQGSKGSGVLGIAIDDQQLLMCQEPIDGVGEIASDLVLSKN